MPGPLGGLLLTLYLTSCRQDLIFNQLDHHPSNGSDQTYPCYNSRAAVRGPEVLMKAQRGVFIFILAKP